MIAEVNKQLEDRLRALDAERDRIRATLAVNGQLSGLTGTEILAVLKAEDTPNRLTADALELLIGEPFRLIQEKVHEFIEDIADEGESDDVIEFDEDEIFELVRRVIRRATASWDK